MDYGKLTKQTLLEMCDAKGIAYSSTFTKDKLIELLFEAEAVTPQVKTGNTTKFTSSKKSNQVDEYMNGTTKAGTIITIVFASIGLCIALMIYGLICLGAFIELVSGGLEAELILIFCFWTLLIGTWITIDALAITFNLSLLRGKAKSKTKAGVFGLLIGLIGGILILVGEYEPMQTAEGEEE